MMLIEPKYTLRQIVYLSTDVEQKPRLVVGYLVTENTLYYKLASGIEESYHYDFEITETVNVLM